MQLLAEYYGRGKAWAESDEREGVGGRFGVVYVCRGLNVSRCRVELLIIVSKGGCRQIVGDIEHRLEAPAPGSLSDGFQFSVSRL